MKRCSSVLVLCFRNITVCPVWRKVTVKFNQGKKCEYAICINVTSTQANISLFFVPFRPSIRPLLLFFCLSHSLPLSRLNIHRVKLFSLELRHLQTLNLRLHFTRTAWLVISTIHILQHGKDRRRHAALSCVHRQRCLCKTESRTVKTVITNKTLMPSDHRNHSFSG